MSIGIVLFPFFILGFALGFFTGQGLPKLPPEKKNDNGEGEERDGQGQEQ
jgi:hypothetical protein